MNPDRVALRAEELMREAELHHDGPVFRFATSVVWMREASRVGVDDAAVDRLWTACDSGDCIDAMARLEVLWFPSHAQVAQRSRRRGWLKHGLAHAASVEERGTPIPMINAAMLALLGREPEEARAWLDRARQQRGWQQFGRVLDGLEVGWACLVGDDALARMALARLPNRMGLQELPEVILAPAAVEVRPYDAELADALEAFVGV